MKLVLALLSLMVVGCAADSGSSGASSKASSPVITAYAKIHSISPVQYQIRVEKWDVITGYDSANALVISGVTSQLETTINLTNVNYKCRIYLIKEISADVSSYQLVANGNSATINAPTSYYIYEANFIN